MWSILQKEHVETSVNVNLKLKNSTFQNVKIQRSSDRNKDERYHVRKDASRRRDHCFNFAILSLSISPVVENHRLNKNTFKCRLKSSFLGFIFLKQEVTFF